MIGFNRPQARASCLFIQLLWGFMQCSSSCRPTTPPPQHLPPIISALEWVLQEVYSKTFTCRVSALKGAWVPHQQTEGKRSRIWSKMLSHDESCWLEDCLSKTPWAALQLVRDVMCWTQMARIAYLHWSVFGWGPLQEQVQLLNRAAHCSSDRPYRDWTAKVRTPL